MTSFIVQYNMCGGRKSDTSYRMYKEPDIHKEVCIHAELNTGAIFVCVRSLIGKVTLEIMGHVVHV